MVPDETGFECDESDQPVVRVPLFPVRVDGVIYDTGMSFTYNGPPDSGLYPYVGTTSGKCGRGCGNMCVEVVLGMFLFACTYRPEGCLQPEELWTVATVSVMFVCSVPRTTVDCAVFDYLHANIHAYIFNSMWRICSCRAPV